MMAKAKFMGGPLHGQQRMVPGPGYDFRVPICLPVHLRPSEDELASMPIHSYRYVRVDDLSDGSTLFMPEAKERPDGDSHS